MLHDLPSFHICTSSKSVPIAPRAQWCLGICASTGLTPPQRYLARQRDAMLAGTPPPDFPGGSGEYTFKGRGTVKDIVSEQGKLALGFSPFPTNGDATRAELARKANEILGYRSA